MPRPISPQTEALILGALEVEALSVREIARRVERTESLVTGALALLTQSGRAVRELVPSRDSYRYGYRKTG